MQIIVKDMASRCRPNWTFLRTILRLCPNLKKLGGHYSQFRWYFDYNTTAYKMHDNFADLVIENPKTVPTQTLAALPQAVTFQP
jgi:hypothetical protein